MHLLRSMMFVEKNDRSPRVVPMPPIDFLDQGMQLVVEAAIIRDINPAGRAHLNEAEFCAQLRVELQEPSHRPEALGNPFRIIHAVYSQKEKLVAKMKSLAEAAFFPLRLLHGRLRPKIRIDTDRLRLDQRGF